MTGTLPAKRTAEPKARISAKLEAAIAVLLAEPTLTQEAAAARAGMTPEALCRALRRQTTLEYIRERCTRTIRGEQFVRATGVLGRLLDAASEYVRLDAAKFVAQANGIAPTSAPRHGSGDAFSLVIELGDGRAITVGTGAQQPHGAAPQEPPHDPLGPPGALARADELARIGSLPAWSTSDPPALPTARSSVLDRRRGS